MPWKDIDINLLRTRLEEQVTDGPGEALQTEKLPPVVDSKCVTTAIERYPQRNVNSTTYPPLLTKPSGSMVGTPIANGYTVEAGDFRYSAPNVMTSKPEEKMKGVKFDEEKPRMALLSPAGIEAEAKAMTYGAKKYGDYNWRKGIAVSRYVSAALRHIFAVVRGEQIDPESGVHHFGLARANLGMALQTLEDQPELNDLYVKEPK